MITPRRRTIASFVLLVFLVAGHGVAQTPQPGKLAPLTVDEYRKVMFDELAKVAKDYPEVRVLGVGSWVGYTGVGKVGDMDATVGHPDPKIEKVLVQKANEAITTALAATGRPYEPKFIKLIHSRDFNNLEVFRGESGQLFILNYATDKAPEGLATFAWKDGQVVLKRAENFWIDTKRALPIQITQPQRFLDDTWVMVNKLRAEKLTEVDRAIATAKYLNNLERWLVPGLEAQYKSGPLTALRVDEASRQQMTELLAIKSRNLTEFEQRAAVARLFNVPLGQVDAAIGGWMTKVEAHLVQTSSIAGLIDGLGRAGKLEASLLNRVLTSGAKIAEKLGPYLLGITAADRALRLGEIALVAYIGTSEGWQKGTEQLAMTLSGWLVPTVAAAGLIAEIGKALVIGGVTLAGNALIFSPLNNDALESMFDPNHPKGVYSGRDFKGFPNPFKGLNRETLYHRFPENSKKLPADPAQERTNVRPLFTAMANVYLDRWIKEEGSLFLTAGAGAFTPDLIVDRIMADWELSRRMAMAVQRLESELKIGETTRPDAPFQVTLDKTEVPPSPPRPKPFAKTAKRGQATVFNLMLVRGFGTRRYLQPSIKLVDKWGELGGKVALDAWMIQNDKNDAVFAYRYDGGDYELGTTPAPADIRADITVRGATGWSLDGELPVNLQSVIAGGTSGQRSFFLKHGGLVTDESSPYKDRSFRIALTPGPDAQPITVTVKLSFTDAFALDKPETTNYELVLTARLEAPTLTNAAEIPPPATRIPPPPEPPSRPPNPPATVAAPCDADYQAAAAQLRVRTQWDIAGYSSVDNSCPAAETVLDACYKAADVRRDSGIHNEKTDTCIDTFSEACRAENLVAVAVQRDQCLALANTQIEEQKARDQAAVALQKAREGQRARELAKQAQAQAEQLARQQEADRLRKIEEDKRAAERRAREQAQQAESQQARRWEELQRQGAAQAALDRQREIDAQRRKAEEADARRRADAERRQREEQDRAEIDARNRPPASDPVPPPISTPPQIPPPTPRPPAEGWPSDFTLETTTEPRGASGVGRVRKEVFEVQQNKLIRYNGLTTAEGTFNDGLLQGRWPAEGITFEFRLNRDGTVVWNLNWVEPSNGQPRGAVRDGTWTMKPLGGSASPSASQPPQVPSPPGQTPPLPTTPPAQTPPARTPPPTPPPAQQQPPCPPAPLPGLANQQTNLRCFGIPGPGQ